jgi:hypothetical protein
LGAENEKRCSTHTLHRFYFCAARNLGIRAKHKHHQHAAKNAMRLVELRTGASEITGYPPAVPWLNATTHGTGRICQFTSRKESLDNHTQAITRKSDCTG